MSIHLNTNNTSPPLNVSAPGLTDMVILTDPATGTAFDISFEDMTTLVEYFLFIPEYRYDDPRKKLLNRLESTELVKGMNSNSLKLIVIKTNDN